MSETFWWKKEFQYLLDRKILSRDELSYLFGQIKSIIEQNQQEVGEEFIRAIVIKEYYGSIENRTKGWIEALKEKGVRIKETSNSKHTE